MAESTSRANRKMAASTSKENREIAASTSKENRKMAASTSKENRKMDPSTSKENREMAAPTSKEKRGMAASTSKENRMRAASTTKENREMAASTSKENREMDALTSKEIRKMAASTSKEKREMDPSASNEFEDCIKLLKYRVSEAEKRLQEFTEEYGKVQKDREQMGKLLVRNRSLRKKFETDLKEEVENRTLIALALTTEQKRISELEEQLLKEMEARERLENTQRRRMTTAEAILMRKTKCGTGSSDSELKKMKLESERATTEQVPNSGPSTTTNKPENTGDIARTQYHSASLLEENADNSEMSEDKNVTSETAAKVEEFHRLHPKPPKNLGNQILDAIESKNFEQALSLFEFRFNANDSDQLETFQKGLYLASALGYYDIVNCYLNKGINPNFFMSKETSLHKAAECGHFSTCKLLLMTGAKVDEQTEQTKMTPLHLAAMNGHLDVCDLLISNKASVRANDMSGCTPLHYAVRSDNLALVKLIIKASTDLCTMNRYGLTPYDYAQALSVSRVEEYLNLIYSNTTML